MSDQELAHRLRMRFGLSYEEPTPDQLNSIKYEIKALVAQGRSPMLKDWIRIVGFYCKTFGTYVRFSVDNTDLNLLLSLALQYGNEMSIVKFKLKAIKDLGLSKATPEITDQEWFQYANALATSNPKNTNDARSIFLELFGNKELRFSLFDSVDNTDLNALLLLAIELSKK